MTEKGKVNSFDGYHGEIINDKKEKYLLLKDEIYNDLDNLENYVQPGDDVIFKPETYKNSEIEKKVARFVKVIKK